MKKILLILLIMLMVFLAVSLSAEKLKLDVNGQPIQLSRYFSVVHDSIAAGAAADSTAIPTNAAEVMIIGQHQALWIRPGSTATVAATGWIYVPKDVPFKLPVMDQPVLYVVYKSYAGSAAAINLAFLRM